MGCNFFARSCWTDPDNSEAKAPNPSPERWTLLELVEFKHAHVVVVQYHDCTNYEGKKILVRKGVWEAPNYLDPHFAEKMEAPIARFPPTLEGFDMALHIAERYGDK